MLQPICQASRAITEEYIGRLKALAHEDAEAGDCRQGGHLDSLMKAQWENCNPACHAKAVSEAVSTLNKHPCGWQPGRYTLNVSGQSYAVIICSRGGMAKILDERGENVSCFRRCHGSWQAFPSDAEMRFYRESERIYLAAYAIRLPPLSRRWAQAWVCREPSGLPSCRRKKAGRSGRVWVGQRC